MKNLKELRKNKNVTLQKLADYLHTGTSTISQYETGKREANFETLNKIATFFNVSIDYLLGRDTSNVEPANLDRDVIKIKIYGKIPAGTPIEMVDESYIEDYEEIPKVWTKGGKEFFGLKIQGSSMFPEFRDGDTIILQKVDTCESGSYCAVSINCTECTFKKVIKTENGITLMPLNTEYNPSFYSNQDIQELPITILGVVKEVRRSY